MAGKSPVKKAASSDSTPIPNPNQFKPPQISTKFTSPAVKSEISSIPTPTPVPTPTSRPPPSQPSSIDADIIHVPSHSRWFSWEKIDSCEVRFLPEFFDGRSPSKGPNLYIYYRNSIIKLFRENPSRKISFTDARRALVGDVGSIRRVFDFLDVWGLINFSASSAPSKPTKDTANNNKSADAPSLESPSFAATTSKNSSTSRRFCGACKSLCTIACFVCDKYDSTLCARCYVRGNFRVGLSNADFRRVEISDEAKADWSEKETLLLLEALMHYGDDWKKVAQHVGGRTDKDCVARFIKLPFGEEFLGDPYSKETESVFETNKRMHLTPLADASNPIMAQAAFLSALAGAEAAEAAARAAVTTLSEVHDTTASKGGRGSLARNMRREADISSNGDTNLNAPGRTYVDVNSLLEKEEGDIERAIIGITEVQMKEIQDKLVHFEEVDLQMEKERQQLEVMKNLLFIDQLNLSFRRSYALESEEQGVDNVKADVF
ncbi:SWI/SNF complex subunit SWI3B-like isoform X2 [Durio zibethinus]|uniref:SWI/SNF complex subunit SWI3B-like isoform X2 n=1 Tax=Durio zibethinus TaxID=66656 RepID=A0A6P6BJ58_DURZI|nr:SWI/SNF complex subunit SWI3B-like isoform X2 [Durio zibethinus]